MANPNWYGLHDTPSEHIARVGDRENGHTTWDHGHLGSTAGRRLGDGHDGRGFRCRRKTGRIHAVPSSSYGDRHRVNHCKVLGPYTHISTQPHCVVRTDSSNSICGEYRCYLHQLICHTFAKNLRRSSDRVDDSGGLYSIKRDCSN